MFVHPIGGAEHSVHQLCDLETVVCLQQHFVSGAAEEEVVEQGIGFGECRCVREVIAVDGSSRVLRQNSVLRQLCRSEEIGRAPSELQSLMRISYAVFCLKKKKHKKNNKRS